MAFVPTVEDAADYILSLFVEHFNSRAGHVLRVNNFISFFCRNPWQSSDFAPGMTYAAEQGWVEVLIGGTSFRLTQDGFEKAGNKTMNLARQCNENVTIERQDGSRHENVRSLVTSKMILVPDSTVPIEPGDAILRQLPSSIVERLIVTDPGFYAAIHGTDAHYQVKYRREGTRPAGSPGYIIHVTGENSRVNIDSIDNSMNTVSKITQNMDGLASEFAQLREAMLPKANSPEHYAAIGAVASAEIAAKSGDPSKVKQALSGLGAASKWVVDVAKDIGVQIASETLKKSMGL